MLSTQCKVNKQIDLCVICGFSKNKNSIVFVTWECWIIRQHMSLSREKAEWSGNIWVCLMRMGFDQAAYEFVTWESWMIRQHMSLSCENGNWSCSIWVSYEKAEWSGNKWVCHVRKLNDQAASEFIFFPLSHEKVKWSGSMWVCLMRNGIIRQHLSLFSHTHIPVWVSWMIRQHLSLFFSHSHMSKLNDQAAFEFVFSHTHTWVSWMIRQHLSLFFSHSHMSKLNDQAGFEFIFFSHSHMSKLNDQAAYEFVTWESWMIRQHMSLSHENGNWSFSMS
jgi:hypothetical protein